MTTDTRAYLALLESDRASLAATVVALEAERDEAIKQRDLWRDDAALRAQNADLWKKRHESDTAELRQHESVWRRAAGALEAERDEARAQVAALREPLATALMHIPAYYSERSAWETALRDRPTITDSLLTVDWDATEAAAAGWRAEVEAAALERALDEAASAWDHEFFDTRPEWMPNPAAWLRDRADDIRGQR